MLIGIIKNYSQKIFAIVKSNVRHFQYELAYWLTFDVENRSKQKSTIKIYNRVGKKIKFPVKPRILFVWPTYDQAKYGLLQALQKWGDVSVYNNRNGFPQYFLPGRDSVMGSAEDIRAINSLDLKKSFNENMKSTPFDFIFTQAWGFSFSFETLQQIRESGCKIINVCMDDRHLFHGMIAPFI